MLFRSHMLAEQRFTQSLDRKQQWIVCVTIAYEAWAALSDLQITSQQQLAPLEIKPQVDNHKSGYGQNIDLAFHKCRCNFRLALMYFKSFLSPLCFNLPHSCEYARKIVGCCDFTAGCEICKKVQGVLLGQKVCPALQRVLITLPK